MRRWTSEIIYESGDRYFADLLAAIDSAESSVWLETYIFEAGPLAERILAALIKARARGLSVRIIIDGLGSADWTSEKIENLAARGIDVFVFHPLPWQRRELSWHHVLLRLREFFGRLNQRQHRKVCIIDQKKAFAGGMNISLQHCREFVGVKAWRDFGVQVEGSGVASLVEAHEILRRRCRQDLFSTWLETRKLKKRHPLVRANDRRIWRRQLMRNLVQRVYHSERRVWLVSPYFVPNRQLLRALRFSAWMGVDVRVLLPRQSDVAISRWLNQAFYRQLVGAGVRIYEYLPAVLHGKVVQIDDFVTIGSSNLNHRSLQHDLELDLVIKEEQNIAKMRELFLQDLQQSQEIKSNEWERRGWWQRGLEWLALRFRYWM